MAVFNYQAMDRNGKEKKGVIEGENPRAVRQILREQRLTPLLVEELSEDNMRARSGQRTHLNNAQLGLMTRQLAILLIAGQPLATALQAIASQGKETVTEKIVLAIRAKIMEGQDLATAMQEFPRVFEPLYRHTVAAGEKTGHLGLVLSKLADYLESREELIQTTRLALVYPALLMTVSFIVVGLLMTFVVPRVIQLFDNFGHELPVLTRILIQLSDVFQSYGLIILGVLFALGLLFAWGLRQTTFRQFWHALLLKTPLVGRLLQIFDTARFARTMSILSASAVPVLDALDVSSKVINNSLMRESVIKARKKVREGQSLAKALDADGYFPPVLIQMIESGEQSGQLPKMLEYAGEMTERETSRSMKTFMSIIEPLLILLVGLIVLFIVLAILLPIFDLNQLIR
ncbi:MAG: type II secretion system inner membrane protein GspF [bacterium]